MQLVAVNKNIVSMRGNLLAMDARKPFIIEVDTTKGNGFNSFTLPLTNHTTDIYVKTSDGQRFTISNYLDPKRTIAFASAGVYTIELRGQCGWVFANTGDCQKLTKIISWGDLLFNYLDGGFYGCINIGLNGGLPLTGSINAPNVIWLGSVFANCNLQSLSPTLLHRCVNVQSIYQGFQRNNLTEIPETLLDKCIKIEELTSTFNNNKLTSFPKKLLWKLTGLLTLNQTFRNNLINTIDGDSLIYNTALTSLSETFVDNHINNLGDGLLRNNVNIINLYRTFGGAFEQNCTLPATIVNLSAMYKVTNFDLFMKPNHTIYSPKGSVQDIWTYANPTATKLYAFNDCLSLTNYNDIPNEWKGL